MLISLSTTRFVMREAFEFQYVSFDVAELTPKILGYYIEGISARNTWSGQVV